MTYHGQTQTACSKVAAAGSDGCTPMPAGHRVRGASRGRGNVSVVKGGTSAGKDNALVWRGKISIEKGNTSVGKDNALVWRNKISTEKGNASVGKDNALVWRNKISIEKGNASAGKDNASVLAAIGQYLLTRRTRNRDCVWTR